MLLGRIVHKLEYEKKPGNYPTREMYSMYESNTFYDLKSCKNLSFLQCYLSCTAFDVYFSIPHFMISDKREMSEDAKFINAFETIYEILEHSRPSVFSYGKGNLFDICCKIQGNMIRIYSEYEAVIGYGIYLAGGALKHSCDADVILTFYHGTNLLRIISQIPLVEKDLSKVMRYHL